MDIPTASGWLHTLALSQDENAETKPDKYIGSAEVLEFIKQSQSAAP